MSSLSPLPSPPPLTPPPWWLKLLHTLPPETAHQLVGTGLRIASAEPLCQLLGKLHRLPPPQPIKLFGKIAPNPLGVAAGLDKDANFVKALFALGFGMVEVGTVTPQPQFGNPTPRLFHSPEQQLLVNRMNFNNQGLARMLPRLKKLRQKPLSGILGVNISKDPRTPSNPKSASQDYITCLKEIYPYADYIAINLSCPNTPDLRDLLKPQNLPQLAKACSQERIRLADKHGYSVPLLLKISPDLKNSDLKPLINTISENDWQGLIASNTSTARPPNCPAHLAQQIGGLSGPCLFPRALELLSSIKKLAPQLSVIGCGGISTKADLQKMLSHGAQAVQIYTAFVYQGPTLLRRLLE